MNKNRFLGYGRQLIDDDDIAAVTAVLRGDFLTQGPVVGRFEKTLAERVGARYAVAVSSGTAALHIACLAAGLKPGQTGVTSALTFVASANAFAYCGANVGLADIDADALGMSGHSLSKALEYQPSCQMVIPVHFAGLAHESAEIRSAAEKRVIVEDACHALGGFDADGNSIGGCEYADMATFSFHPVKSITTAEGGAVTTNDERWYQALLRLRNHGIERDAKQFENAAASLDVDGQKAPWYYEQQALGYNYRMSDLQAALGLSQLAKLDTFVARRREIARHYDTNFSIIEHVRLPQSKDEQRGRSAHHLYIICIDYPALGTTRSAVMECLRNCGVGSQVHYLPVYLQPFHQKRGIGDAKDFPVTEAYYSECLSLPLHAGLTNDEVEQVIRAVRQALL